MAKNPLPKAYRHNTGATWAVALRMTPEQTRAHATAEDPGRLASSLVLLLASLGSLLGVGALLVAGSGKGGGVPADTIVGVGVVAVSWVTVHTVFALHYARVHYTWHGAGPAVDFNSPEDPDYHVDNQNFFVWWFHFMEQYITIWQMLIMAVFFNIGLLFFSEIQLIVFWVVPAILSTFQLFYFGTYRPHRLPHTTAMEPYKARSQKTNHLWALASCYFFGYHYEHHLSPKTPWWELYKTKHT